MDAERLKIRIANEVLCTLIEWIPLQDLQNVRLANRRFWVFGDEALEKKEHTIKSLFVDYTQPDQLKVARNGSNQPVTVPFAEVEPPRKFKLDSIRLNKNVGEKGLAFLRHSKRLFTGAVVRFSWRDIRRANALDKFEDVFERCSSVKIWDADSRLNHYFYANSVVLNCDSLQLFPELCWWFDPSPILDWLHTPPAFNPTGRRQLYLSNEYSVPNSFLSSLEKRFTADEVEHTFVIQFYIDVLPIIRITNELTGEVLLTRSKNTVCCLIRCSKGKEDTMKYIEMDKEEQTRIRFG